MTLVNSTTGTLKKPRLREARQSLVQSPLRHPARTLSGSVLTARSPHVEDRVEMLSL